MTRILVTGATGFVGTALLKQLRKTEATLICQSRQQRENEPGIQWIKHDLAQDSWEFLPAESLDIVYYLAGQTSVYTALENPIADLKANVLGLLNLLEQCRKWKNPPFVVLTGTVTQMGLSNHSPITENEPDQPITFYDLSNLTAEKYLLQYVREGLVKGCVLRLANIFGRRQPGQKEDRGILDKVFARALAGQEITVYGDGNYIRDYVFIDDVVSALVGAATHQENTNGKKFNIGTGTGTSLKDAFSKVAAIACAQTGVEVDIEHVPAPDHLSPIEFRNAVFDCRAFQTATDWQAKFDFDSALKEAYGA